MTFVLIGSRAGGKEPPRREFIQTAIPGLEPVTASGDTYADGYEWHALVTNLDLDVRAVSNLYRERGDCENVFDEMKNQWDWGGFVTRDLKRTAIVADLSAFVANIWNMFCRLGGRRLAPGGGHDAAEAPAVRRPRLAPRQARHGHDLHGGQGLCGTHLRPDIRRP